MIRTEKYPQALRALQQLIVHARFLAYRQEDFTAIADLLDWAEYLPQLIAAPKDRTENYAAVLQDLAGRFPFCSHIAAEFKQDSAAQSAATVA